MPRSVVDYKVVATLTREVIYIVPARSSEEAEMIVEAYIEEGAEPAEQTTVEFRVEDAYPVEEESMGQQIRLHVADDSEDDEV